MEKFKFSTFLLVLVMFILNFDIVRSQDDMNMNEVIKDLGYLEIKDRSKLTAGDDALQIRIPPKESGHKPDFKYYVQASRGKPPVEITIEPDAPIAVGQSLDWNQAQDINKNRPGFNG